MSGFNVTISVTEVEAANAWLEERGHGPCFSVPLRDGSEGATHVGFHAYNDAPFRASVDALAQVFSTVVITDDGEEIPKAAFTAHAQSQGLEYSDPRNWFENPVMKDDERTQDGRTYRSLVDYNVWPIPIGWREVVSDGYPEWVRPSGAHDAYPLGERVTYEGSVYESRHPANVWSPTEYPAGWLLIEE